MSAGGIKDRMVISGILDQDSLEAYLTGEGYLLSRAIAYRAALRTLPAIFTVDRHLLAHEAILLFRVLLTTSLKLHDYYQGVGHTVGAALVKIGDPGFVQKATVYGPARTSAAAALRTMIHGNDNFAKLAYDAVSGSENFLGSRAWSEVRNDCLLYEQNRAHFTYEQSAQEMASFRLWELEWPSEWFAIWKEVRERLAEIDPNFIVWTHWFENRLPGQKWAFKIDGDTALIEDKKILRRLAEATDTDFWGKGHEYVNATLKVWLDEARARVALPSEPLGTINPDPQDTRSPQFGLDPMGHIAIKADAGTDQLRSDPQSLARHSRALLMAQKLGEALHNHNNAGYMTEMVDGYVAAMESDQERPDPSGLVFAGDQLREAITKHRAAGPNDDLQPLPPSADRDASAFLAAHNMYVGSDPFLDDLDRTTRGPDAPLPSANPDEIMGVVTAARQADIVAEPTYDYMVAASNAAPAIYDPADRHSRFAAGLAQNFARYGIEFLWAYPTEAAWAGLVAVGVGAIMAPGLLVAAVGTATGIGIAYKLARNMIANEDTYRKWIATSPAGEDNFNRLMRFLKSLPIKSLNDD